MRVTVGLSRNREPSAPLGSEVMAAMLHEAYKVLLNPPDEALMLLLHRKI